MQRANWKKHVSTLWCFHRCKGECSKWISFCTDLCECECKCECHRVNQEMLCSFTDLEQKNTPSIRICIRMPHTAYHLYGMLTVCIMQYAVCGMRMGMSLLFPSCDGTSKFLVNSMVFTFAFVFEPNAPWIDPLAAFAYSVMWKHHSMLTCFSNFCRIRIRIPHTVGLES